MDIIMWGPAITIAVAAGHWFVKREVRALFTQTNEDLLGALKLQSEDRRETLRIAEKAMEHAILIARSYGDFDKECVASGLQHDIMRQMQKEEAQHGRSNHQRTVGNGLQSGHTDGVDTDPTPSLR